MGFSGMRTKSQGDTSTWTAFYSGFITYSEITLEYKGEGAEMLCDEPRAAGVPFAVGSYCLPDVRLSCLGS